MTTERVLKYGFLFRDKNEVKAKQGEKVGNELYMLRERGTSAASGGVSECNAL